MSHCSVLKVARPEKPIGVSPFVLRGDVPVTSALCLANDTSTMCWSRYFFPFRRRPTFLPLDRGQVLRLSNCSHLRAARPERHSPHAASSSTRGGVLTITGRFSSTGEWLCWLSLAHSLTHSLSLYPGRRSVNCCWCLPAHKPWFRVPSDPRP
jgi:hypothetical protein